MKMIQGWLFFAISNKSRTRFAPTPTYISTKSEPETEKKGTPASPATAFANKVLPVPGGPTSNTPDGIRAPRLENFLGDFKNSTTSCNSSFSSSAPATSLKRTFKLLCTCVLDLFIFIFGPPLAAPRSIKKNKSPIKSIPANGKRLDQILPALGSVYCK